MILRHQGKIYKTIKKIYVGQMEMGQQALWETAYRWSFDMGKNVMTEVKNFEKWAYDGHLLLS